VNTNRKRKRPKKVKNLQKKLRKAKKEQLRKKNSTSSGTLKQILPSVHIR